jgi:hypothetical protein
MDLNGKWDKITPNAQLLNIIVQHYGAAAQVEELSAGAHQEKGRVVSSTT